MKNCLSFLFVILALLGPAHFCRATTYVWSNPAGGFFSGATNWSPTGVPAGGDTALITNAGTYTVVYDLTNAGALRGAITLVLGAGGGINGVQTLGFTNHLNDFDTSGNYVITNGGVVNVDNCAFSFITILLEDGGVWNSQDSTYSVPIEVTNAVYNCINDQFLESVTLDNGAQFITTNLFNATVEPTSMWQVNTGAVVTIDNGVFLIDGFVTNAGTMTIENNGDLQIYNDQDQVMPYVNGELVNSPGGLINLYGVPGIHNLKPGSGGGYELFINQGVVMRYGLQSLILVTEFDNSSGIVSNLYPSTMAIGYFQNYVSGLSGNFYATNGGGFQFYGGEIPSQGDAPTNPAVVTQPLNLDGSGQYALYNGNFELSNTVPANLLLESGTLYLSANFQGGAITNLALDGITLTNTLPVTGVLSSTNSILEGNFSLSNGGVLDANYTTYIDGNVTVADGGLFNDMAGAVLNSPGSLTIQNGGTLLLNSGLTLNSAVTNYGVITLTNGGGISLQYNGEQSLGELVNASTGVIQIDAGGSGIGGTEVGCYFLNQGQIVKNFSNSGVNIALWDFDNSSGTITNLTGTLEVGNFLGTLAGNFYAASGTEFQLTGGAATNYLVPGTPLVLGGPGAYVFYQGYLDLPNNIVPGLVLQNSVLTLGAGFQGGAITNLALDGILLTNTLPVTGTFNVTNSALYGMFTVTNGGTLNADNSANIHSGITVASGGQFNVVGGSTVQSDGWLSIASGGTLDLLANLGMLGALTNYGTIITTNAQIQIGSLPAGMINETGGNFLIYGSGGAIGEGYLINDGTIVKTTSTGSATIGVTSFTNAAAIVAQHGTFQLGAVTLLPMGSLTLDLNSALDYGNFNFTGNAGLAGTLTVLTNNYLPPLGTVFNILTYRSFSGGFGAMNLPFGTGGWQTQFAATVAEIQAGLPHLSPPVLSKTYLVLSGSNGLALNQYRVLATTNLALPLASWTPLATNDFPANGNFNFTNSAGTLPREFFRLSSP